MSGVKAGFGAGIRFFQTPRGRRLLPVLGFVLLPLIFFWPVLLGGKTLLPADNLFAFEPWRTFAASLGVRFPHNELLSDLILENYVWKQFILQSLHQRQIPLWNPYLFAGVPFLAAGQHSAMYPLSLVYYALPLPLAYGVFTYIHFVLAGLFTYLFVRTLGASRAGAFVAGVTFTFSAFMVVSVDFPMIVAAVTWLPFLLWVAEKLLRLAEASAGHWRAALWVLVGAAGLGMQILAGHVEIMVYVAIILAYYTAGRLVALWVRHRRAFWPMAGRAVAWLAALGVLGIGLGAVQWIPLYELVRQNFRQGAVSYQQVVGWAYPWRQIITFFVPDFFGNPSHHQYFDLFRWQVVPVTTNALGEPITEIAWTKGLPTWKNYVEAGSYVGILPLLLAVIAVIRRRGAAVWIFASLAVVSVLMAFGTPLYALFFYLVPGANQLHSPFRWVFAYTLSMAVLAGLGITALSRWAADSERVNRATRRLAGFAAAVGALGLGALLLSRALGGFTLRLADRFVQTQGLAQRAFADGAMLYSYQFRNFFLFGLFLLLAGLVVRRAARARGHGWKIAAAAVVALDLFVVGIGFNPRTDPALLEFKPPVVDFLQRDQSLWRFTTFIAPGEKPFNANSGMIFGFQDIRGYDSIIPKQYVEYMGWIEAQDELLYNRIAPLSERNSLDSPLLHLLNVKYVITTQALDHAGYKLVYDGEVRVYENQNAMPRAFALPATAAVVVPREKVGDALKQYDPREYVVLEEEQGFRAQAAAQPAQYAPVAVESYAGNEVFLKASLAQPSLVVLGDSYFPGWKAYARAEGDADERELALYRADGNFRAVYLEPGTYTIRFKYTPMSFKLGLYASFLAAMSMVLLAVFAVWRRFYRADAGDSAVKRVAKNSLVLMGMSLLNRFIDLVFAMLMLRILAPVGAGRYQTAVNLIGYFEILVLFGLGTLLTREASKKPEEQRRYLGNTLVLRLLLWAVSLPILAGILVLSARVGNMAMETVWAVLLFSIGLIFSSFAEAISSVFYAHEQMEYPAAISSVTTILRVMLGALVLLLGWGVVGLAGVSVVVNVVTLLILGILAARFYFRPRLEFEPSFGRRLLSDSYPLMINHLLATIFFRIDIQFLQQYRGDAEVGYYSAAHRWIDALQIVPSYFTLAIFPLMSRYAESARESLVRAYILSLRLLLMFILPVTVITLFISRELIAVLGGSRYLPQSMIALQLLILSRPFGFINAVTQYVLIAIDQQRFLTKAFLIGMTFNVVMNFLFVPRYGYQAAAAILIFSEIALLLPFYYAIRKHLTRVPWVGITWQPLVASLACAGILWATRPVSLLLGLLLAIVAYPIVLWLIGGFRGKDLDVVLAAIPVGRFRSLLRGKAPAAEIAEGESAP